MTTNNTPVFNSTFSSRLYDFVEAKRRDGYKYNGEVKELQRLDRYLLSHELSPGNCNSENIYPWLYRRSSESDKTFSTRNSVYRQLYSFLTANEDYSLPAPPNAKEKIHGSGFVPYIFTHDEISGILDAADNESSKGGSFAACAPLLFRVLYGTGLRVNEALSLTAADVKYEQKLLVIREAKNDNSRLVPVSDRLFNRLDSYLCAHAYSNDDLVFQHGENHPLTTQTAYEWFRLILWRAGIHHGGRGKGPRLHDLRHTFAVHSLQAAIERGADPNAFLPLLCVYLGHRTLSATERYLRLTAEAFPSVQKEMDEIMSGIIPEVKGYE